MPIDYILEMIEELGRAMRAIIARRKDQPAKALEEIKAAFSGTKFGSKAFFDGLSAEELAVFLREKEVDYRAVDYMVDILLEEAEINRDQVLEQLAMEAPNAEEGDANHEIRLVVDSPQQLLLLAKIQVLIDYTSAVEASLKIYSLKRGPQKERLKGLSS
ncbi:MULTISPECIES: hypothetical protein [unclassified Chitinophaga]|uniref:hypothetical protein n=1 Tax=unclassified Chitinophaga TaxID=2619133 RepID=UPI0009D08718|nr:MULTISPECIES: hypothetical protein [unclassified Chitinophaga]OMP76789.1 hypothetical protein BW716_22945 [[Flexibacter] sp. ATCC 35208]WPV65241.1 hypothetical protein QQL36_25885 [Chitinophaga sp. LS1]